MEGIWLWSYLALWGVVLFQTLLLFALMRQVGLLHLRVRPIGAMMGNSGPELGARAPEIVTHDFNSGRPVTLGTSVGKSTLLVFISPGCPACGELMPGLVALQLHEQKTTDIILVSDIMDERPNREFIERYRLNKTKYILSSEITEEYRIGGSPYAVLIDAEGIVRTKGLVNHLEHLESLLNARDSGFPGHDSRMNALTAGNSEITSRNLEGGTNAV